MFTVSYSVRTTPDDLDKKEIDALDCRHPQKVQTGLLSQVCTGKDQGEIESTEQNVLILYSSTRHSVPAVRCEKRVSRLAMVCGSFSHSKILSPPDILQAQIFKPEDCRDIVGRRLYTKEDGGTINIEVDHVYSYKFIEHGHLHLSTSNVACEGASILIHGERHDSIVSLVSAEVKFTSLEIEMDIGEATDLESHVKLPTACAREKICQGGSAAYVIDHPPTACDLYILRSLPMSKTTVRTEKGEEQALVSHKHKVFFLLQPREVTSAACRPVYEVISTNYQDIKVVLEEDQIGQVNALSNHISASQVDIDLELRTASEYLSYRFETLLAQRLHDVAGSLCKAQEHTLSQAELSPFHKHSLLRVKGELLQELSCRSVQAELRLGEKRHERCYADAIPGWVENQPVLIAAQTRLVITHEESQTMECSAAYAPVFRTNDGTLVQADPVLRVVEVTLTHFQSDYLHLDEGQILHESYEESILYSSEEIAKFNSLIHFERSKTLILDSLVQRYCASEDCGAYTPGAGSSFSLTALEDRMEEPLHWAEHILQEVEKYGGVCSIVVLFIMILTVLYRIGQTVYLSLCRKVHPMQALRLSFFLNETIRGTMLDESVQEPATPASAQAPPSSTESAYSTPMRPPVLQPVRRMNDPPGVEQIPLARLGDGLQTALVPYRPAARRELWN